MRRLKSIFIVAAMLIAAQNIMAQKALKMMEKIAEMPKVEQSFIIFNGANEEQDFNDNPFKADMTREEVISAMNDAFDKILPGDTITKKELANFINNASNEEFEEVQAYIGGIVAPMFDIFCNIDKIHIIELTGCDDKIKNKAKNMFHKLTSKGYHYVEKIEGIEDHDIIERTEKQKIKELVFLTDSDNEMNIIYASGDMDFGDMEHYIKEVLDMAAQNEKVDYHITIDMGDEDDEESPIL